VIFVGNTCKRGKAREGEEKEIEKKKKRRKIRVKEGRKTKQKKSKVGGNGKNQAPIATVKSLSFLPNLQSLGTSKGSRASWEDRGV
jgi:hypothetical protein